MTATIHGLAPWFIAGGSAAFVAVLLIAAFAEFSRRAGHFPPRRPKHAGWTHVDDLPADRYAGEQDVPHQRYESPAGPTAHGRALPPLPALPDAAEPQLMLAAPLLTNGGWQQYPDTPFQADRLDELAYAFDAAGEPVIHGDWRHQTAAELAPDALDAAQAGYLDELLADDTAVTQIADAIIAELDKPDVADDPSSTDDPDDWVYLSARYEMLCDLSDQQAAAVAELIDPKPEPGDWRWPAEPAPFTAWLSDDFVELVAA
jgi:hypothetical protein